MPSLLAAFRGDGFGIGTAHLAPGEAALILFLLALVSVVLLLTLLFIYLGWRQSRFPNLPPETLDLIAELEKPSQPRGAGPASTTAPWERPEGWWR